METPGTLRLQTKALLVLVIAVGTMGGCTALGVASMLATESPELVANGPVAAWTMGAIVNVFGLAMIYVAYKLIRWVLKDGLPAPGVVLGRFERVALAVGGIGWWFTAIVCLWGTTAFMVFFRAYGIAGLAAVPVVGVIFSIGMGWIVFKVLHASKRS